MSQKVSHVLELLLLNGHKCGAKVKTCKPSPSMVTSPYEWKILEWDENKQTNKQIVHNTLYDCQLFTILNIMSEIKSPIIYIYKFYL